jgi:MFS family permease
MINLGAFLAPLVVSVLKGFAWKYVFIASSLYCAAMLLPALFVFREPPRPPSTKSLREVLAGAAMVLGDARFMLMVVVYSVFWIQPPDLQLGPLVPAGVSTRNPSARR